MTPPTPPTPPSSSIGVPLRERLCVPGGEGRVKVQNLRDALDRVILAYLGPATYQEVCVGFGGVFGWSIEHCKIQRPAGTMGIAHEKRTLVIDGVPFCVIHQEGRFGRVGLEWLVDERARW
jgi:hypothetical protein